jgi:hypothetical protein
MNLIYFDESKNEPKHPHYHIGAVCIDESHLSDVEQRIASLSQESFGSAALSADTEFHAAEIYHRKRHFKDWADFERRIQLLERFAQILSMEEVLLIDIQINSALLYASQSPADIAFMFLCEKANDLVRSKRSLGMLIGDRESDQIAARCATTLSDYRASGTDFALGRDIKHLVDSVHFTHSHLSRFLQLADVYVWLRQFVLRNQGSDNFRHQAVFEILRKDDVDLFPAKYKEWPPKK